MINAVLATIIVSVFSLVGALILFKKDLISPRYGSMMISIAAGVMLATAILGLLPEALESLSDHSIYWALLGGIGLFFVMERLMHWYHHHQHSEEHKAMKGHKEDVTPTAYLILIGDSLHNFFDGLAIATAFSLSFEVGIMTTIAIILHEIPQELADFIALVHSGLNVKKALWYNLLTALTAVLGAVLGWYFINSLEGLLPYMIAFNAGMFIYISCSDLIPALHEDFKQDRKWLQTIAFILAALVMGLLIGQLHHGHEADEIEINRAEGTSHLEAVTGE